MDRQRHRTHRPDRSVARAGRVMADSTPRPMRVGLYGFFGMGNLGNEGSLAAFLAHLLADAPRGAVVCFGADAAEIEREHGIPGDQLMAFRAVPGDRRPAPRPQGPRPPLGHAADGRVWSVGSTCSSSRHRGAREPADVDPVGPSRTGWPWPSVLPATRRPAALVSVGAEPATRSSTRRLMRQIIRSASHVTYRDAASRAAALGMGAMVGTQAPWCPMSRSTYLAPSGSRFGPGTS